MAKVYPNPTILEENITSQIQRLKAHFEIVEEAKVAGFLQEYPFLTDYALEAKARLAELYQNADFALEVLIDPEDYDGSTLDMWVITHLEYKEARAIYNNFLETWWIDAFSNAQGKINVLLG
jgi:hypothetical protein